MANAHTMMTVSLTNTPVLFDWSARNPAYDCVVPVESLAVADVVVPADVDPWR